MTWFKDVFGREKVIVASLYIPPLPGSPLYRHGTPLEDIIAYVRNELEVLEAGGMDAANIGNQQNWPYELGVGPETVALMTHIISEAHRGLSIPFGITVFWDDLAAIAIAKATGAAYVRGVFRGVYAGEMGLMALNAADALRFRQRADAEEVKLMFMLRPIAARAVGERDLKADVKDAVWASRPDAFALCGPIPGEAPTLTELALVEAHAKGRPVFANNGANPENIGDILRVCSGAVIGTHLRADRDASNPFDRKRVAEFMQVVNALR